MATIKREDCVYCGSEIFEEVGCCGSHVRMIYTCGCHTQGNKE